MRKLNYEIKPDGVLFWESLDGDIEVVMVTYGELLKVYAELDAIRDDVSVVSY